MFSLKKISLALIIFAGISNAYLVPKDYNYLNANNWLRLDCDTVGNTDMAKCGLYYDAKQHSLSDDPAECYVYGVVKNSDNGCTLFMPEHPCEQGNSQPWISECFQVYYAGSISVNGTKKALKDNVRIGSFSAQLENFGELAFFSKPSFGYEQAMNQQW